MADHKNLATKVWVPTLARQSPVSNIWATFWHTYLTNSLNVCKPLCETASTEENFSSTHHVIPVSKCKIYTIGQTARYGLFTLSDLMSGPEKCRKEFVLYTYCAWKTAISNFCSHVTNTAISYSHGSTTLVNLDLVIS